MIIEKTNYGKKIKVWNDLYLDEGNGGYSKEWSYSIRNVRPLNDLFERLHPSIDELEVEEKKLERKLLLLLFSMENVFRAAYEHTLRTGNYDYIFLWEEKNRLEFNRYYHDQIHDLIDAINGISLQYTFNAGNDGYGWCF